MSVNVLAFAELVPGYQREVYGTNSAGYDTLWRQSVTREHTKILMLQ